MQTGFRSFMVLLALMTGAVLSAPGVGASREPPPPTWDGMKRVERKGLDTVYVRDGVDLSRYKRVSLDPVEVSFDKDWNPRGSITGNAADPAAIRRNLAALARDVFKRELERKNGYPLVQEEGPDVLRVRAQIVDLFINAPDTKTPGVRAYVVDAGEMTLVAELYDSQTNALIARVVDRRRGSEFGPNELQIANQVTNTAEADRIISGWARRLREALDRART